MNQGLLKTAVIVESVALQITAQQSCALQTSVATDMYIEQMLPQIFKKARPMACENLSAFALYEIKESANNVINAMQKVQLKLDNGLLFAARIEFENSSFAFLLLRTNKEIEAIDTELKAITASDFKKGLLAMLMHVEHDNNGEITETYYTFDSHFKRDSNDWNMLLGLTPIQDDYAMTTDLVQRLCYITHNAGRLNGLQRLQLQQIIQLELWSRCDMEFSIVDFVIVIQSCFKELDLSSIADMGLFVVDGNALRDSKKAFGAKLHLDNGMIISYSSDEMPRRIEGSYYDRVLNDNMFKVIFKEEVFE
jgi:hypothetical protein